MRHLSLLAACAALAGCSSAPPPPQREATRPFASASVMPSAAPSGAVAVPVASPKEDEEAVDEPAPPEADIDDPEHEREHGALALGDGTTLVVAVRAPVAWRSPPALVLALVRGGKVIARRDGFAAVTGVEATIFNPAQTCTTWRATLARASFGSVAGARVSIGCTDGEDYFTATELAVLFRLDKPLRDLDGLTRIWAGLGDAQQSEMDCCSASRRVDFRLINDKTLEKTITEVVSWTEQVIDGDLKNRLKKNCHVGTTKRVERVALP